MVNCGLMNCWGPEAAIGNLSSWNSKIAAFNLIKDSNLELLPEGYSNGLFVDLSEGCALKFAFIISISIDQTDQWNRQVQIRLEVSPNLLFVFGVQHLLERRKLLFKKFGVTLTVQRHWFVPYDWLGDFGVGHERWVSRQEMGVIMMRVQFRVWIMNLNVGSRCS